jgi:hypothetical protein
MSYSMRIVLFAILFAVLCVKGGELCSAGGAGMWSTFFEEKDAVAPEPIMPPEKAFRGLSPRPAVERLVLPLHHAKR